MYFAHALPKSIDLHVATDMKAGDTVRFQDGQAVVPDVNVYGFAYYIWQQINRWQADGATDYGAQIFRFQAYVTPSCRAQLEADLDSRYQAGELRQRTRQMTEIPGLGYAANRVLPDGQAAWTVLLDMQLMEAFRGQPVKDAFIRYPIRVVRYDVDRERNPWRLAIDCYGSHRPERLDVRDVQDASSGKTEASLPSVVTPPALPRTTGDAVDPHAVPTATPLQHSAASAQ
jgi:integrating conjugative element protein (TIGR03746 family)